MVMQARKLPRLSDGYFDRNQSHSFENSGKYSKSNDRASDKLKGSPLSGNSDHPNRNDVSENKISPRYHRPCSQRLKEKDHHEDSSKSPIVRNDSKSSANKDYKSQSSSEKDGSSDKYQSNHDRNEEPEKRLPPVDWTEHISSSGKKYYYNCKTEVSQWEKPKELTDWERAQNLSRLNYEPPTRPKERAHERLGGAGGSKNSHPMDCGETPEGGGGDGSHGAPERAPLLSPSQVTMSNLPRLISQLAGTKGLPNLDELSPQEALRTIQQALQLTRQATNLSSQIADSVHYGGKQQLQLQPTASPALSSASQQANHHPTPSYQHQQQVNSSHHHPFPDAKNDLDGRDRGQSPGSDSSTHSVRQESPTSSVSSLQSLGGAAGTSSLAGLKPSLPSLTPSLANYYREDLIAHVLGWQADHAERQANRYWEDGHNIGSLNCTQVSAELKISRSLVRLAEIKATLKEQRILFLKQQTKELEEWRSLNSYMGDS